MSNPSATAATGERIAAEALRYLEVIEAFASLAADPHAAARERAVHRREIEDAARARAGSRGTRPSIRWKR